MQNPVDGTVRKTTLSTEVAVGVGIGTDKSDLEDLVEIARDFGDVGDVGRSVQTIFS